MSLAGLVVTAVLVEGPPVDVRAISSRSVDAQDAANRTDDDSRRWWTESQPARFDVGDRVRSTEPVGGMLGGAVPAGSLGEVVSTQVGLFGESVTVRFENGYAEEVEPNVIKHEGWF